MILFLFYYFIIILLFFIFYTNYLQTFRNKIKKTLRNKKEIEIKINSNKIKINYHDKIIKIRWSFQKLKKLKELETVFTFPKCKFY